MPVKAYVVGRPQFDTQAFLTFLADVDASWRRTAGATVAEELVEAAGRVCYMSFGHAQSPRDNAAYIENLIKLGHYSVLEHVDWSFVVCGITRSLSHQLVRHRVGFAFSQLSQQYHDESSAECIMAPEIAAHPRAAAAWNRAVAAAKHAYNEIRETLEETQAASADTVGQREVRRSIRSAARSVLPACTGTTVFLTANARALRHFFTVRGGIPGDREMRELAAELLNAVKNEAPHLFLDFEVHKLDDGSPIVRAAEGAVREG